MSQLSPSQDAIAEALASVAATIGLINTAMLQIEAVHGIRLLEPRNDLSEEIKALTWSIARLNGCTDLHKAPVRERLIGAPAVPHRTEMDPFDLPDESSR